jgi:hypothetical protein
MRVELMKLYSSDYLDLFISESETPKFCKFSWKKEWNLLLMCTYNFKRTECPITWWRNLGLTLHDNGDIVISIVALKLKHRPINAIKASVTHLVAPTRKILMPFERSYPHS